jgi:hypothetical protein
MTWYEIINAKSDSYSADRDAEDLVRQLATAVQSEDGPLEAEMFYGLTSNGARRYYVSLSPEAVERVERVLTSYDATELTAPPDLTALVPFDVDPSLRAGCPAACGEGGQFPARWELCLGALLSPSTCIPPHAAQRLCPNVLLSPNAKVVPAHEHPDPLQPSCRAMVLVRV